MLPHIAIHDAVLDKYLNIFMYIFDIMFVYAHDETMHFSQLNVKRTVWSSEWIGEHHQLVPIISYLFGPISVC